MTLPPYSDDVSGYSTGENYGYGQGEYTTDDGTGAGAVEQSYEPGPLTARLM